MRTLPKYPKDHPVGMVVPKGGSSCAKCKFVRNAGLECVQKDFAKWFGGENASDVTLPAPANEYCCDFFETRTEKRGAKELRVEK